MLQKPRSPLETVNDLDGNVVNFFRVLRDNPDELIRKIRLTPWAREEYAASIQPPEGDPIERARLFWARCWMTIDGSGRDTGFRVSTTSKQTPAALMEDIPSLWYIVDRLAGVQVENKDAIETIKIYDNAEALIYFDPPYVVETRAHKEKYAEEVDGPFHINAAATLRNCEGFVIVSGYACPLYAELYEAHGWKRIDRMAQTNSGGKRVESLWLNPRTVEAQAQPALFDDRRPY